METEFFFIPQLLPFVHWAVIMCSYHFSKYFTLNYFIDSRYILKWYQKVFVYIGIGIPTFLIATVSSLMRTGNFVNVTIFLEVSVPSLGSCWFHMGAHQNSAYQNTRAEYYIEKEKLNNVNNEEELTQMQVNTLRNMYNNQEITVTQALHKIQAVRQFKNSKISD